MVGRLGGARAGYAAEEDRRSCCKRWSCCGLLAVGCRGAVVLRLAAGAVHGLRFGAASAAYCTRCSGATCCGLLLCCCCLSGARPGIYEAAAFEPAGDMLRGYIRGYVRRVYDPEYMQYIQKIVLYIA